MIRHVIASSLIAALMLGLPGTARLAQAEPSQLIRIATLAPRGTDLTNGFIKIDQGLRAATKDQWGIRLYPAGIAGDEVDVIRKMKVGQMDSSIITTTGLSQIVREVAVLDAPGVIRSYKQLEAVQTAMNGEWEKTFDKAGFKLLAWGETGQYRYFSKLPINKLGDIKPMRPWLWPASQVMKDLYLAIGANGVPLGLPEVYGGLQTDMIDMVIATSIAVVALQWHAKLTHVTGNTFGVLLGSMIMNNEKWNAIPPDIQKHLMGEITKNTDGAKEDTRKSDDKALAKLKGRGYTVTKFDKAAENDYDVTAAAVRKKLAGRVYPAALLKRVEDIVATAK